MNKPEKIKNSEIIFRGKSHWWLILILWGTYACMIFPNIHKLVNNPIPKGLVVFTIIWVMFSVLFFFIRFVLTIDDEFVKFKSNWRLVKIHITDIKDVNVKKMGFWQMYLKYSSEYHDFTGNVFVIQTKNGKNYRFAIKNAQKIKEEIEKRMLTINNTSIP